MGYIFPPGAKAGESVEVEFGGADWTPDVEILFHDERVKVEVLGPLGPVFMPQAPYLIGDRAYDPPPLPREMRGRITVPPEMPAGPVYWQAANANGSSSLGVFVVGTADESMEIESSDAQRIESLPSTINGRLDANEDVDGFAFTAAETGPVTCELWAGRLGSKFNGVLEIRDDTGAIVDRTVDTRGVDPLLEFAAEAGRQYEVRLRELDFRGHRSFVYRLSLTTGARESETIAAARLATDEIAQLDAPGAVTAEFIAPQGIHRYRFTAQKNERWHVAVDADRLGSPVDAALTILGPDGMKVAECDDRPGTTDPAAEFVASADGEHTIEVADLAGSIETPARIYRLRVERPEPDFRLEFPQRLNVLIGGSADLVVKAERRGGFAAPIAITLENLPPGVSAPSPLEIPADATEFKIALTAATDAPASARLVEVTGRAQAADGEIVRKAAAQFDGTLAPATYLNHPPQRLLVATTMAPRVAIRPVETDERTVHRGSTHLAPISIQRLEGFAGPVVVQTEGTQPHKFRQGILGPDVIVPPQDAVVLYPCFVPHQAETLDAYRFSQVAIAEVPDPQGNVRHLLSKMETPDTSVAITVEGSLLGVSAAIEEPIRCRPGSRIEIPVSISRSPALTQPVQLEIARPVTGLHITEADVDSSSSEQRLQLEVADNVAPGTHEIVIRAAAHSPARGIPELSDTAGCTPMSAEMLAVLKSGRLPCYAETAFDVEVVADDE